MEDELMLRHSSNGIVVVRRLAWCIIHASYMQVPWTALGPVDAISVPLPAQTVFVRPADV